MPEAYRSVSLHDVMSDGTSIQPHEAVTIVQQVCRYLAWKGSLGEPVSVPPIEEIRIDAAGEAVITDLKSTTDPLSVRDLGRLLEALLPEPGREHRRIVPGPLRFILARAIGDVDARPFGSPAEFSAALAPFERETPRQAIGALFDRWRSGHPPVQSDAPVLVDGAWVVDSSGFRERRESDRAAEPRLPQAVRTERRRRGPRADTFRLLLREADQREYESAARDQISSAAVTPIASGPASVRDRRGHTPDAATFRRMLREADRALYERLASKSETADANASSSPGTALIVRDTEVVEPVALVPLVHEDDRRRTASRWLAAAAVLLIALTIPVGWRAFKQSAAVTPVVSSDRPAVQSAPAQRVREAGARQTPAASVPAKPASEPLPAQAEPPAPSQKPPASPDTAAAPRLVLASGETDESTYSPSFASNGSAVFFHEGTEPSALKRADTGPDGAVLRVISIVEDSARNYHVRVSPDGESIAFDSDRDGVRGVYVATREGKDVRRVTGEGFAAVPTWAPEGRRLAYVRGERDKPNVWNLWVRDLESGAQRRLTDYPYGQPWGASWFPDGRRICYSHEDALYVMDLETGKSTRYRSPVRGRLARTPAVSPDGRRVVFQVHRDGVWLLDLKDGGMRRILEDPSAEEFTWSPDGRRVAYHSQRAGGWALWILGM
jgi:Tol biopolymer transport system component